MTINFIERTKLSTLRMCGSASATFLATWMPGQLFIILGQNNLSPFLLMGLIFTTIFIVFVNITAFNTWEKPVSELNKQKGPGRFCGRRSSFIFKLLKIRVFECT